MHATHHKLRMLLAAAKSRTDLFEAMGIITKARKASQINDAYLWNLYEYFVDLWQNHREKERQANGAA